MDKSRISLFKPCTKKDQMHRYGVSYNTIVRWCEKIGINTEGGLRTPKHLRRFYEEYDMPE